MYPIMRFEAAWGALLTLAWGRILGFSFQALGEIGSKGEQRARIIFSMPSLWLFSATRRNTLILGQLVRACRERSSVLEEEQWQAKQNAR